MLYLIHGTDRHKVIAKTGDLVAGLKKRRPEAEVFSMTDDDTNLSRLLELSGGQGLFESKYIERQKIDHFAGAGKMIKFYSLPNA